MRDVWKKFIVPISAIKAPTTNMPRRPRRSESWRSISCTHTPCPSELLRTDRNERTLTIHILQGRTQAAYRMGTHVMCARNQAESQCRMHQRVHVALWSAGRQGFSVRTSQPSGLMIAWPVCSTMLAPMNTCHSCSIYKKSSSTSS